MLKTEEILGKKISKMNRENLEKLKKRIQINRVSWILGAGVSKDVGVPLWSECLQMMWSKMLLISPSPNYELAEGKEFRETIREIAKNNKEKNTFLNKINASISGDMQCNAFGKTDPVEIAEYVYNLVKEAIGPDGDLAFLCLAKDCLKISEDPESLFRKMKSRTLGLLANYMNNQVKNGNIVRVITYNFDNLLEFALEQFKMKKDVCHVKNPGDSNELEENRGVYIYHPHGTVSVIKDSLSEESNRLVLAQSNYERLGAKAYIWENSVQAKALHDSSCVFLGFSGEDSNFRRIIKNIETIEDGAGIEHYLFISIESMVKMLFSSNVEKELLGNKARTEDERKEFLNAIEKNQYDDALRKVFGSDSNCFEREMLIKRLYAQYLYWQRYNIVPIWTTRNELSEMIESVLY